jgi:hypothetical protein
LAVDFYKLKLTIRENPWNIILGLYIFIMILLISAYYFSNSDKANYNKYKDYEASINKKQQIITNNIDKSMKGYAENKIHKKDTIYDLRQGGYKLEKLYSSFSWNKGDENTKALFIIKKQIILNTAQIYLNKAKALEVGIGYNDGADKAFIDMLMQRYNLDEQFEKERFNIKF